MGLKVWKVGVGMRARCEEQGPPALLRRSLSLVHVEILYSLPRISPRTLTVTWRIGISALAAAIPLFTINGSP